MCGEVITIQVGQCGNQVGTKYWEVISEDHGVSPTGTIEAASDAQSHKINVSYREVKGDRYVPRTIFVDLEPGSIDAVRGSWLGRLFNPDNLIYGKAGASNNYAVGYYSASSDIFEQVLDAVRGEIEKCDKIEGFQVIHSVGGGTGAGFVSKLIDELRSKYCHYMFASHSVFPSPKVSDLVTEYYNSVLATSHLIENVDLTYIYDNEALYNICFRTLTATNPTYADLNHLLSAAISNATCSLRFPGKMNSSIRKIGVNLVLFPRQHFLMSSYAPLAFRDIPEYRPITEPELIEQLFDGQNLMCAVDPRKGRYLSGAVMFRGEEVVQSVVEEQVQGIKQRDPSCFVNWIADSFKIGYINKPPAGVNMAASLTANSTAVNEVFRRQQSSFKAMWQKKAYVHWYTGEGMDEMEFLTAESSLVDLISEYDQYN